MTFTNVSITWATEMVWEGKTPINDNMRTEFAWFHASDGYHSNIINFTRTADITIIILPKSQRLMEQIFFNSSILANIKNKSKYVGIMQEGPHNYWEDYPLDIQLRWYHFLNAEIDFIMCHNTNDASYYEGMFPNTPVYVNKSLLIPESLDIKPVIRNNDVMLGGNLCKWYGGFKSYIVANQLNPDHIIFPKMGRMLKGEDTLDDDVIKHIEYASLKEWANKLNECKYGVHLMPVSAAGTFSLYCAYLGIPCIGNIYMDTQAECFPYTSVLPHQVKSANMIAEKLRNDDDFYDMVSTDARLNYEKYFSIDVWKSNFNKTVRSILEIK